MNRKAAAVKAWTDWRAALNVATAFPRDEDVLSAMLRAWWKEQDLVRDWEQLTEAQADSVLAKIAELDWSCRPFTESNQ